jgi:hypothetical protein
VIVSGCGDGGSARPAAAKPAAEPKSVRTETVRGPVRVVVEVAPAPARLSDELRLSLTIEYEAGVEIEKLPFGDAVGDFLVRDFRESLPDVQDDRETIRQTYTLEPTRTGPVQIAPIAVAFHDKRPHGDGARHQLETEAITIEVLSMVDSNAPSLTGLKGFDDPIALPPQHSGYAWWLGGVLAAAAVIAGWWFVRRARRPSILVELSPREQAQRELDRLWQSEVARRDVKQFYVALTGIVRRYIERSTGIQAAEQTTEEFLREAGRNTQFARDERQRLKDFLESADLVKFAAHHPLPEDVEEAYRRAQRFVGPADSMAVDLPQGEASR